MTEKSDSDVPGVFQGGSGLHQGRTVTQAVMPQLSQLLPLTPEAMGGFRAFNQQKFHVVHAEFRGTAGCQVPKDSQDKAPGQVMM